MSRFVMARAETAAMAAASATAIRNKRADMKGLMSGVVAPMDAGGKPPDFVELTKR